jgi:HD superfamily phosphohydrolase
MEELASIPELVALEARSSLVRIPDGIDVPLTRRVGQIVDSSEFQRLAQIKQLGLVSQVYPAAHHTRFEHSLGVYRMSLLFLQRLQHDERFAAAITKHDAEVFLAAALLHDLGHWPYCHPIEDMNLPNVPSHELFANSFLLEGEIADTLRDEWGIAPREVVSLLSEKPRDKRSRILRSMLSGPIDIDKMDYLYRDSLHAGVPYGRNFDQQRLIGSLCLNQSGNGLALTVKGKTAAEMMVFARYVMFSEVYWHHAVRASTAMLQRAFFDVYPQLDLDTLFRSDEQQFVSALRQEASEGGAADLLESLFGSKRRLHKRLAEFSFFQHPEIYEQLSRQPYDWLVACAEHTATELSQRLGRRVAPHEVIIDAPPVELEVQFKVDIFYPKENAYRTLGDVSPVVKTLATHQFDDFVKRVRIFGDRELVAACDDVDLADVITKSLTKMV